MPLQNNQLLLTDRQIELLKFILDLNRMPTSIIAVDSGAEYAELRNLLIEPVEKPCVAMVGNISDGYTSFGPFVDFEAASEFAENEESWITTLVKPRAENLNMHDDVTTLEAAARREE